MKKINKLKYKKFSYYFTKMFYIIFSWILIFIVTRMIYTESKLTIELSCYLGFILGIFLLWSFLVLMIIEKEVKK